MSGLPLFVYGTLRDAPLRAVVLGRRIAGLPARAQGWRAVFWPGRAYPVLVPAPAAIASGLLLAGLDARDRDRLDAYEGREYHRVPLRVALSGAVIAAEAYLPCEAPIGPALPWTLAGWRRSHKRVTIAEELRRPLVAASRP